MLNLWTLAGLSLSELLRRTARESWEDAVFGQGGRMAFYQFLALFPSLLVLLAITARVPHLGEGVKISLRDLSIQVLPVDAAQLFQNMVNELSERALSGRQLIVVCAGALWGAVNATWAMIYGLNTAYEVREHRPHWKLAITIAGLTLGLGVAGCMAILLMFSGTRLEAHLHPEAAVLRAVQWIMLAALLSFSFAVLYRFAPNLRDHEWRWSTPGALCALILWLGATVAARFYFDHLNDYSRSYGHLNSVIMLLLWLYVTNGAILIGGEMNSEIEKAAAARTAAIHPGTDHPDRSGC